MDELRTGNPIVAGEITIVPIERSYVQSVHGDLGCWLTGLKEPIAIIVFDANGICAYDTKAVEISVASLIQKIKGLSAVLDSSTQNQRWQDEIASNIT